VEDDKIYSVGIVSRRTGLSARQLRYYESLGLVLPSRRGNRRLYSEGDIVRLSVIRDRHEAGERLEEIGRRLPVQAPVAPEARQGGRERPMPYEGPRFAGAREESDLKATSLGRRPLPSLYPLRDRREIEARMDRYERERMMEDTAQDVRARRRIGKERSHDEPGHSGS
jgi:MerR family glutamine synthetase transcriptional repressor